MCEQNSFHPSHIFESIIRCQFICFKRICSTFQDFQLASSIMTTALVLRGYSLSRILHIKWDIWHNYTPKPHTYPKPTAYDIIPVITYFDNHHSRLNRQWSSVVHQNPIFSNIRIISAYKRHRAHTTHKRFTALLESVRDYLGEQVPER